MDIPLQGLMQEAARLTRTGRLEEATRTIQRALRPHPVAAPAADAEVIDGCVFEVARPPSVGPALPPQRHDAPVFRADGPEEFSGGSFVQGSRSLDYKLYVPPGAGAGRPLPLVVMLHGCTQDADDFATGTGMNTHAREQGFYVLYPAQSKGANAQRCWNWFKHSHQERGRGEPALIAGLTRRVMQQHAVDSRRVYVAGLSAGGAMAAIVAQAYPELFAAVGVHSGLPAGVAANLGEALNAMRGNGGEPAPSRKVAGRQVPAIVFHGDQDQTVHQRNGEQLIEAALARSASTGGSPPERAAAHVERGVSARGRRYTRTVHVDMDGATVAEHWLVHGAGHAWSGGLPAGSYTDAQGPDATAAMLRFFLDHPHADPRTP